MDEVATSRAESSMLKAKLNEVKVFPYPSWRGIKLALDLRPLCYGLSLLLAAKPV